MKSVPKLIRRFVGILILSSISLLVINIIMLVIVAMEQTPNASPWTTAKNAANALEQTENGYVLSQEMSSDLASHHAWAMFIDNSTHEVIWHTDNLPNNIPLSYTLSQIVDMARGYIDSYPTFTGESEHGIMIVGFPPKSYWKHMWPSWDYDLIANSVWIILSILGVNIAFVFLVYVITNTKLMNSVKPITKGIYDLPTGEPVRLKEKGLLSEIAANINRTSDVLQSQNYQLRKKETARANWIAGVSHDIRTPLSMVMGYAAQLESNTNLTQDERQIATVILKQSEKMRNLVNDLNLASKLEYNMQPLNCRETNAVAVVRQVVVDFINTDIGDKYPIEWKTEDNLSSCIINVDKDLLKRAISNLIQNSMNHNENGCTIYISVGIDKATIITANETCVIAIEDNGVGASHEKIEKLNHAPHYMVCDTHTTEQQHGLGLLIVKQIAVSHGGTTEIGHSSYGGLSVKISLPFH